ncbi:hypothetical protein B0T18DRAFT_413362 [Schizothecium vesticola]|uniref:Amine oxidase n=1 Tax=Schizothecium vesticola TaxID=314040 RepID=A0AA40ENK5_9PEZI|nr:hypothetical protein B0T18DRAFT_413362 [Schizothecium vesticola]
MLSRAFLTAAVLSLTPCFGSATINIGSYLSSAILVRDVAVIGGGSSGTYAAVQLKRAGYSTAVVEKASRLGGHVDTYRDPVTGQTFDYGVLALLNTSVVRDYFALFSEALTVYTGAGPAVTRVYANLATDGEIVTPPSTIPWTDPAAVFASFLGYGAQISQYPFLSDGYSLPNPVPEDLLLPFGDFLAKHDLQALAGTAFSIVQGVGNLLATTTLYVFKYLPKTTIDAFVGIAPPPVTSATFNIQALYNKALAYLGSGTNVLLNANVIAIERDGPRVLVAVLTPSGPKLIIAKKLLVAIQPKLSALQGLGLDLTLQERDIFGQFNNSYYWDMVLKNTGLPSDRRFTNIDVDAPLGIAPMPGLYGLGPGPIANLTLAYYSSPSSRTDAQVKAETLEAIFKLKTANGFPPGTGTPEFVGFNDHRPFWLTVPPAAIAGGFYDKLNGLQGKKNTWWTGATFVAHDSSAIWNWTEVSLLPRVKASL